jgi:hypothetical protein
MGRMSHTSTNSTHSLRLCIFYSVGIFTASLAGCGDEPWEKYILKPTPPPNESEFDFSSPPSAMSYQGNRRSKANE